MLLRPTWATLRSRSWVIDFDKFSGKAQVRWATLSCDSSYRLYKPKHPFSQHSCSSLSIIHKKFARQSYSISKAVKQCNQSYENNTFHKVVLGSRATACEMCPFKFHMKIAKKINMLKRLLYNTVILYGSSHAVLLLHHTLKFTVAWVSCSSCKADYEAGLSISLPVIWAASWENGIIAYAKTKAQISCAVPLF